MTIAQRVPNTGQTQDRIDAEKRVRRADYDRFETIVGERSEKFGVDPSVSSTCINDLANNRIGAQAYEVVLEVEPAAIGAQTCADALLGHRQEPSRYAQPAPEVLGDLRQALPGSEAPRALDMRSEVAVAEVEPGLAPEHFEGGHKGPGFVSAAPAHLSVVDAGERVEERV